MVQEVRADQGVQEDRVVPLVRYLLEVLCFLVFQGVPLVRHVRELQPGSQADRVDLVVREVQVVRVVLLVHQDLEVRPFPLVHQGLEDQVLVEVLEEVVVL